MKVPVYTLGSLPDALNFAEGAAISCGTGTAYGAIRRRYSPGGKTMSVVGQGPVGLSATMLGVATGTRIIAVDISEERLALAKSFGADSVVNAANVDPIEVIHELTNGQGADYAMECSCEPDARLSSIRSTRTWGTVCLEFKGSSRGQIP